MHARTLYALLGATLLTATGTVMAEAAETNATSPSFYLKVGPAEAWTKPGQSATFSVVAEARTEQHLQLSIRTTDADGLGAKLASDVLDVFPGAGARTALTMTAPQNVTRSPYHVVVIATSADGSVREAKAVLHVRPAEKPMPAEKPAEKTYEPRPAAKPVEKSYDVKSYDVLEHRFRAIIERMEAIEKRLAALEGRLDRPEPRPTPAPEPIAVRMTLSPEHATIGPDGGKVALLLASGDREGRVPLGVRYNESSGWTIKLDQTIVKMRANDREWIWIHLTPPAPCALVEAAEAATPCPAAAAVIEYAIVQPNAPDAPLAKGTATARTA